jgi:hypothetical protein
MTIQLVKTNQLLRIKQSVAVTFPLLIAFLSFFLLSGCGSQPAHEGYAIPKSFYSQQCYITEGDSYIWLEQEDDWLTLPENSRVQLEQAQVNWLEENILIVSLGKKPSSGFDVQLTGWLMEQDHWQVMQKINSPGAGSLQAMMITSPCVLVKIPKTIKSFTLKNENGVALGRWMQ